MVVCAPRPVVDQLLLPWRSLGCANPAVPPSTSPVVHTSLLPVAYHHHHHQYPAAAAAAVNPWPQFPYSPSGGAHTTTGSSVSAGMKRNLSDSDSDDVFDDVSSKGTPTQSNESCQMVNRKKRRGIIEKRRRDRINSSLTELRRLVPTAFEKQGSAKLEKAEILQMTVDHLKMLHAKGFDAFSFDPHKFAMDYHSIGFRECAAEVARYMVTVEGMDIQDPLRLRLMSHLQCYSAQRELAAKQANPWGGATSGQWGTPTTAAPSSATNGSSGNFPSVMGAGSSQPNNSNNNNNLLHMGSSELHLACSGASDHLRLSDGGPASPHHMRLQAPVPSVTAQAGVGGGNVSSSAPGGGMMHHHHPHHHQHLHSQMHASSQYPVSLNINTHHGFATAVSPPSGYSPTSTTTGTAQAGPGGQHSSVKPYRPWGAELAY